MLTPQEVSNSVFEKAVFGGYDIASVDKLMAQLTQDYTSLYRENGILKTKMKVLVDKVEEYRSTEDAMHMALLQAERTAKDIVAAAEAKRDTIEKETAEKSEELLKQAEAETEARRAEIRKDLAAEEAALNNAKKATAEYLDRLKNAMSAYAETLNRIYDFVEPLSPQPEQPASAEAVNVPEEAPPPEEKPRESGFTQDTVENIAEIINRAISSTQEKEKTAEEAADPESTISKLPNIDYDNLLFGKNYDPTKK